MEANVALMPAAVPLPAQDQSQSHGQGLDARILLSTLHAGAIPHITTIRTDADADSANPRARARPTTTVTVLDRAIHLPTFATLLARLADQVALEERASVASNLDGLALPVVGSTARSASGDVEETVLVRREGSIRIRRRPTMSMGCSAPAPAPRPAGSS
ncbi:hypothetical protein HMN09_00564200 [Mycena chlorophos]|uniref:Uncharacterized protein n=1 Tax=Mycena chlorophos TaxID=658473 RepID=A0A8H6WCW9_MYCCL|nr:hypothetical protein HMN09_00564200 [Mycena chlorophos]